MYSDLTLYLRPYSNRKPINILLDLLLNIKALLYMSSNHCSILSSVKLYIVTYPAWQFIYLTDFLLLPQNIPIS